MPVACTSSIGRKTERGGWESVPLTYTTDPDGMYRLKERGIAVWAPKRCVPDMAIYKDDRSVKFVSSGLNWIANDGYMLEFMKTPSSVTDDASFIREIASDAKDYVDDRPRQDFVFKSGKRTDINGRVGYQVTAVDGGRLEFVATFERHASWITIASLMYPVEAGTDQSTAFPRKCYRRFVESVTQVR